MPLLSEVLILPTQALRLRAAITPLRITLTPSVSVRAALDGPQGQEHSKYLSFKLAIKNKFLLTYTDIRTRP